MKAKAIGYALIAVLLVGFALGTGPSANGVSTAQPAVSGGSPTQSLAAKYVNDAGIQKDPNVLFADDFEGWGGDGTRKPADKWHGIRENKTSLTRAIPGNVVTAGKPGPGNRVLEIACWHEPGESQAGGLSLKLGNYNDANEGLGDGYDELYVRYYIKSDENYRAVQNHGSNLGGRDLTMKDPAWVGMAAIRDVASRGYFYSGLQPLAKQGSQELEMGFYSYHMDKKGPWGDGYEVQTRTPIQVGTWHCVERHMRLNSIDSTQNAAIADGREELWVDGKLSIRRDGLRFRRVPQLKITFFSLETYYHGLPEAYGRPNPIKVYFDNVVIAREYIGPMQRGQ